MENISVVIIDDEILSRNLLKEYLLGQTGFSIIAECKNGIEAIGVINALQPDLIFLDIQMPGKTGFEVLEELEYFPKIIFSTAYDNFALKAFDANAIDYLLKPYTKQRFMTALDKVKSNLNLSPKNMENLLDVFQVKQYPNRVLVQKGYKLLNLEVSEIVYIEAQDDYALIYTSTDSFLTNKGIGAIQAKLNPEEFLRIHRSYIVSMKHIREIIKDTNGYQVVTSTNKKINVSRTYTDAVNRLKI